MTRRPFRWLTLIGTLGAVLVAAQMVPYGYQHTNPAVVMEPPWDAPATRDLAKRACFDCHSNETQWPAYSRVAPVSWLIRHDVDEGRAVLNFSEWQRPQGEASEAAEAVLEGEMPLWMYRAMHADARLTDAETDRLSRGLMKTLGTSHGEVESDE
jgi:mono/diheme cytochrome c family protein